LDALKREDAIFPVRNGTTIFLSPCPITTLRILSRLIPLTLYGPNYSCEFKKSGQNNFSGNLESWNFKSINSITKNVGETIIKHFKLTCRFELDLENGGA
jgi:hypothetical protein